MTVKQILPAALTLTLPLAGANAQQWSTNTLPSGLITWWQAEGNLLDSAGAHHGSGASIFTHNAKARASSSIASSAAWSASTSARRLAN